MEIREPMIVFINFTGADEFLNEKTINEKKKDCLITQDCKRLRAHWLA